MHKTLINKRKTMKLLSLSEGSHVRLINRKTPYKSYVEGTKWNTNK
jgi:hypothetical protein